MLGLLACDDSHLADIFDLDSATNDRLTAESNRLPGISPLELVSGFPHYRIVNAAYCHAHPEGSRFNGPDRGAWYAAFKRDGALAEVIYHKTLTLSEINHFYDDVTYDDYLADFRGSFHDIRNESAFLDVLAPNSYIASQRLAAQLLTTGSVGIVYPSVRHPDATNLVCFRPALVNHVRRDATCHIVWEGKEQPHTRWE